MEILFNLINALGSVATVGAFIYLFKRDDDKQNQIDALTTIARLDERRLKHSVLPDIRYSGGMSKPGENRIDVELINKGDYARLMNVEIISGQAIVDEANKHMPYPLDKDATRMFFLLGNGQINVNEIEYAFKVSYLDKIGTIYELIVKGKGGSARIVGNTAIDFN